MNQFYYNIYTPHTCDFHGTVAVERSSDNDVPPSTRATIRASEILGVDSEQLVAITSTQEQFWKTGI